MSEIHQTEEDLTFAGRDLMEGLGICIFEETAGWEMERIMGPGKMVSSPFVAWQRGRCGQGGFFSTSAVRAGIRQKGL